MYILGWRGWVVLAMMFMVGAGFGAGCLRTLERYNPPEAAVLNIKAEDLTTPDGKTPTRIVFSLGGLEWVSIGPDAFYVRGVKVEAGDAEARAVFDATMQFMFISSRK